MNGKWIEIFRAGKQTDSAGQAKEWTEADLDAIVARYNGQTAHEAPVVVGHPESNSPSFGWVEALKRDGKLLFAKMKDVMPAFEELVKAGTYKKRSISLYPDLTLRHIGFLGGMPPAIKGLADIAFRSGEESTVYEFSTKGGEPVTTKDKNPLQRLFAMFMDMARGGGTKNRAQFCADCQDQVCMACCPTGAISMTAVKGAVIDPAKCTVCCACCQACCMMEDPVEGIQVANYSEQKEKRMKPEEVEKLITQAVAAATKEFSEQIKTLGEQNKTLGETLAGVQKQFAEGNEATARAEFTAFCEALPTRVLPAEIPTIVDQMMTLRKAAVVEFSEGDVKKSRSAVEDYQLRLKNRAETVQFGEFATGDLAGQRPGGKDAATIAREATEFMDSEAKAGRVVTIDAAVTHVQGKGGGK